MWPQPIYSIFKYFDLPFNENEGKYVYELRRGRQSVSSIAGRVFRLKSSNKTPRNGFVKNNSPAIDLIKQKHKIQKNISRTLRGRIKAALQAQGVRKCHKTFDLIGCGPSELREYLESKFTDGMNWENKGYEGWHVDHILPLASFDLSDEQQSKKANHYTNLQPLWKEDNFAKRDKIL